MKISLICSVARSFGFGVLVLGSFWVVACKRDATKKEPEGTNTAVAAPKIVLPETPVEVVRMWEDKFENSEYNDILPISAGGNVKYLIGLIETEKMAIEKGSPIPKPKPNEIPKIIQITCNTDGDKGECICLKEDPDGRYNVHSIIIRENNQWKVIKSEAEPENNQ